MALGHFLVPVLAKQGAAIVIVYLGEHQDAQETQRRVQDNDECGASLMTGQVLHPIGGEIDNG